MDAKLKKRNEIDSPDGMLLAGPTACRASHRYKGCTDIFVRKTFEGPQYCDNCVCYEQDVYDDDLCDALQISVVCETNSIWLRVRR